MTSSFAPGTHARGTLLLADISGYTAFLQGVADAHRALIVDADEPPPAYAVLSKLLDTIVATLSPAYRLVKFEGDAVFAVAQDAVPRGDDVLAGLTDAAIEAMDVPTDGMLPLEESYDDTPPVAVHVVALA